MKWCRQGMRYLGARSEYATPEKQWLSRTFNRGLTGAPFVYARVLLYDIEEQKFSTKTIPIWAYVHKVERGMPLDIMYSKKNKTDYYYQVDEAEVADQQVSLSSFKTQDEWLANEDEKQKLRNADLAAKRAILETQRQETLAKLEISRPEKYKIGVRLCSRVERFVVGFTEAMSPDNGKIQIRIHRGANGYESRQFQGIILDNPDNWDVCEAK